MTEESQDQQAGAKPLEGVATPEITMLEDMAARRIRLALLFSAGVCLTFFLLPVLGQFTSALDGLAFGGLTWAWVFAFAQFVVAVLVATRYASRAAGLDAATAELLRKKG
jgi:uncharacterized membrane protein (DUF485 family)